MLKKFCTLTLPLSLLACSSPQDPSESNFADSLENYFEDNRACVGYEISFPFYLKKKDDAPHIMHAPRHRLLQMLVKNDILERREEGTQVSYQLTDDGRDVVYTEQDRRRTFTQFCYGEYELVDIIEIQKHNPKDPVRKLGVSYSYTLEDAEDWTADFAQALKGFNWKVAEDLEAADHPAKRRTTMHLTQEGWVHKEIWRKLKQSGRSF